MTKKITLLTLLFTVMLSYGQREADKKLNFDTKVEDVFLHNFSGVPIVLTEKTVAGLDAEKGTKIWEIKGDRISLFGGAIQEDKEIHTTVPFSPYLIIDNLLVDTRDGKIILDKANYKSINSFSIVPEIQSFIFQCELEEKGSYKLYLIELTSNSIKWEKDIQTKKRGELNNLVVDKNNNLAFTTESNLLIVNSTNGDVIFNEEEKVGKLFLNPQKDVVYAVEASGGGLGSMVGAAMTFNVNKLIALGKKIYAYNTSTGKPLWKKPIGLDEGFLFTQDVDGKMFIQHEKGGNIYDYNSGEKLWKRDYEKRNINKVEKVSEGYKIYFGARNILVDNEGKKLWKKPQYNGNEFLEELGEEDTYDEFVYSNGSIIATPYRISYYENGQKKALWKFGVDEETRITYDTELKNLVVLDGKKLYILNPDKGWGEEKGQKLVLKKHNDFNRLEVRGNNYFLSSPWEYVIVSKTGEVLKTQYYEQPGESGRKWLNALAIAGSLAGSAYEMAGLYNVGIGGASGVQETAFGMKPPGTGGFSQAEKGVNQYQAGQHAQMAAEALHNPNRHSAFSDSRDYAFYYTKSKDGTKYLVQVNKDDGNEVDKFIFLDNKPNYEIDEVEKRVLYSKNKEVHIFDYK